MVRLTVISLVLMAAIGIVESSHAEGTPQTLCPVMGNPINKDIFVDHDGQRVYLCCNGCVGEFKKSPGKYLSKMAADGIMVEKSPVAQTMCPVMNQPINREIFADHDGQRVYFCCNGCVGEFKKDPSAYLKKMTDAGVTPEVAPVAQTVCPVSGDPINTACFMDHEGRRVYFCGDDCKAAFSKSPGKYVENLVGSAVAPAGSDCAKPARGGCPRMGGCGAKT
ncbi:MAG: hypothetical protein MUE60_05325 [Candidatus Eisenbacteria bacterium]|jgi:YHS domain-containing protein|nr:hypothetical protein [Candidatus Eisenbacteria bacterium]